MPFTSFTRTLLLMFSAPLVWALHFLLIYVLTALLCAERLPDSSWLNEEILRIAIGLAGMTAIAIILFFCLRTDPDNSGFITAMTQMMGWLSIYAIILESVPVLLVPVCS